MTTLRTSSSTTLSAFALLGLSLLLFLTTISPINAQQNQPGFYEPDSSRRDQTFSVLEFENGNINQRYDGPLRYYCTFRGKWNEERHPQDFPLHPSWSAPVIISHSNGWRMWTGSETATLGVESIAEVSVGSCVLHCCRECWIVYSRYLTLLPTIFYITTGGIRYHYYQ
jgi:hypothetical protein